MDLVGRHDDQQTDESREDRELPTAQAHDAGLTAERLGVMGLLIRLWRNLYERLWGTKVSFMPTTFGLEGLDDGPVRRPDW